MQIRSVAVGALAGFLIAWFLLAPPWGAEPAPFAPPAEAPTPALRPPSEPPAALREPPALPDPARIETFRSGGASEVARLIYETTERYTREEVESLVALADRARTEGDENLFSAAVYGLVTAGTERAKEKLHALLADESLDLPTNIGARFVQAFREEAPPDVAALARRRCEKALEAGTSRDEGFYELIAIHGSESDLDWLLEHSAWTALLSSGRRSGAERLRPLLRDSGLPGHFLHEFAREQPEILFEELPGLIEQVDPGKRRGQRRFRDPWSGDLLRTYGTSVPPAKIDAAKAYLLGLRKPWTELAAVYAVESMAKRKLDVTGLEPVILAPTLFLERWTRESGRDHLDEAVHAIEYNRVAWSDRAVTALRHAAAQCEEGSLKKNMLRVANNVESGMKSTWK